MVEASNIKIGQKLYLTIPADDHEMELRNTSFIAAMQTHITEDFPVIVEDITPNNIGFRPVVGGSKVSNVTLYRPFEYFSEKPRYKYASTFRLDKDTGDVYRLIENVNPRSTLPCRVMVKHKTHNKFLEQYITVTLSGARKLYDNDIVFT